MRRTLLVFLFACVALIPCAGAAPTATAWSTPSTQQIDAIYAEVESMYLDLHRSPELAMQEKETAAKLAARVKSLGYDVTTGVGGTGVVAVLKNGPGRTVLLRTDMDALPIAENTGLPFSSHVIVKSESGASIPVMHACGHDIHMSSCPKTAWQENNRNDKLSAATLFILKIPRNGELMLRAPSYLVTQKLPVTTGGHRLNRRCQIRQIRAE